MLATHIRGARLAGAAPAGRRAAAPRVLRRAPLHVVAFKSGSQDGGEEGSSSSNAKITFQLPMHVEFGQAVAVIGGVDALGAWDVNQAINMAWNDGDVWTAEAEVPTGTVVEYKYVIVAGEGEAKEVLTWQPCDNLEVQAEPAATELTIRDAWEGSMHEVLPGTLPLPVPAAADGAQQQEEEGAAAPAAAAAAPIEAAAAAAAVVAEALVAVAEPAPAQAAAAPEEAPKPKPAAAAKPPVAAATAATAAATAAASAAAAKAAGQARRRSTASKAPLAGSSNKPANGNGRSANGKVVAAAAAGQTATDAPATPAAAAPAQGNNGTKLPSKAEGAAPTAATAQPARTASYGSLTTPELRDVCKTRGLSAKGQRKDLLGRLQQLLKGNINKQPPQA